MKPCLSVGLLVLFRVRQGWVRAEDVYLFLEPGMTACLKELELSKEEAKVAKQEEGRYRKYLTRKLQPESGTVCTDKEHEVLEYQGQGKCVQERVPASL